MEPVLFSAVSTHTNIVCLIMNSAPLQLLIPHEVLWTSLSQDASLPQW